MDTQIQNLDISDPMPSEIKTVKCSFDAGPIGAALADREDGVANRLHMVTHVENGSQAAKQGVKQGAVILEIAGHSTRGKDKDGVVTMIASANRSVAILFTQPTDVDQAIAKSLHEEQRKAPAAASQRAILPRSNSESSRAPSGESDSDRMAKAVARSLKDQEASDKAAKELDTVLATLQRALPILKSFIDEHCFLFVPNLSTEDSAHELFIQYDDCVDSLIPTLLSEKGIELKDAARSLIQASERCADDSLLAHLLALESFELFQDLMCRRNEEMHRAARDQIASTPRGGSAAVTEEKKAAARERFREKAKANRPQAAAAEPEIDMTTYRDDGVEQEEPEDAEAHLQPGYGGVKGQAPAGSSAAETADMPFHTDSHAANVFNTATSLNEARQRFRERANFKPKTRFAQALRDASLREREELREAEAALGGNQIEKERPGRETARDHQARI